MTVCGESNTEVRGERSAECKCRRSLQQSVGLCPCKRAGAEPLK